MKWILALCILFTACSFDYGKDQERDKTKPDIVMLDVEYVRVRGGDPQVRFQADSAERFEESQVMNLINLTFEEFVENNEVDSVGNAGLASIELDSGNISLAGGVKISIESEDFIIETSEIWWQDKDKQLYGNSDDEVQVNRSDGTSIIGRGFSADGRYRTWTFSSGIEGILVETEDEESGDDAAEEDASGE